MALVTKYGTTQNGLKLHRFKGDKMPPAYIGQAICGVWIGSLWYSEEDGPGREECKRCFPTPTHQD